MAAEGIARFFRNSFRRRSSRAVEAQDTLPKENRPAVGERNSFPNSAGHLFFEYLIVVSLKKNINGDYEPKITYQFPKRENLMRGQREEEDRLLQAIPLFCFPDGNEWAPLMECKSETFSFVLTNVDGSRKIGYCRRLLPSGRGARLPEVYCIVSCLGCFGLFSKILDEVEKRRQISTAVIYPFMQGLRESPFPAPGKTVTIKSFIPDSGTEQIELTRPLDSHLEHVEFQALLQHLSPEKILLIFASAVLERRIVFLAEELSSLSKCIHAAAALLYPFNWAHTYIPVVPEKLLSTVCCPTPFMVGIQKRYLDEVLDQPMEEVLLVDLCEEKFLKEVGDEEEILPAKLQSEMLSSLPAMNNNIQTPEELNVCVSDTFVQFFVKTIGHYPAHIKWNRSGQGCFQERSFCKAPTSKTTRKFLKKFVKTQMFSLFIQEAEQSKKCVADYFQKKLNEHQEQKKQRRLS
ncbi:DENN domain-containing protein 2D [Sceloporus undulatus]|uniref:DENN domain-containing protein 2D n=1 Tax=Sceloporus undulatus TaxID=8520 RepID=UPI001C4C31ED|nr:DENN domain-containing protein 2D [Sceloporus undulatus]